MFFRCVFAGQCLTGVLLSGSQYSTEEVCFSFVTSRMFSLTDYTLFCRNLRWQDKLKHLVYSGVQEVYEMKRCKI